MDERHDQVNANTATGAASRDARAGREKPEQPPAEGQQARRYALAVVFVALATLLGLPWRPIIEPTNLVMVYLLAVILAALQLGRGPAVLASLLSVLAFDLVFVPPFYTLAVSDVEYILTFAGLLGAGLVTSSLAAQAREQARFARMRDAHTAVLFQLSRDLAAAGGVSQVAQALVRHVEQLIGGQAAVLIFEDDELELSQVSAAFPFDETEAAAARWAFANNTAAGRGEGPHGSARGLYLPLKTAGEVLGVLGVRFPDAPVPGGPLPAEQQRLLESFASQGAIAVERSLLAEQAREARLLQETEKLQTALLNSISHDLRTPLAAITGALSSLHEDGELLDTHARQELLTNAYEEAERLNSLVANLLDMSRLEAGALRVGAIPVDIEDVLGVALSQSVQRLHEREIRLEIPAGLPLVSADFVLLARVFVNLLDNADKYAPLQTAITVRSFVQEQELWVQVLDRGPGIFEGDRERIFEKFYRGAAECAEADGEARERSRAGTGLGLSISKGIVEAHRGRIWAENRPGGGAIVTVALPLNGELETAARSTGHA